MELLQKSTDGVSRHGDLIPSGEQASASASTGGEAHLYTSWPSPSVCHRRRRRQGRVERLISGEGIKRDSVLAFPQLGGATFRVPPEREGRIYIRIVHQRASGRRAARLKWWKPSAAMAVSYTVQAQGPCTLPCSDCRLYSD